MTNPRNILTSIIQVFQAADDGQEEGTFTGQAALDIIEGAMGLDVGPNFDPGLLDDLELKHVTLDGRAAWCICIPGIGCIWWSLEPFHAPTS